MKIVILSNFALLLFLLSACKPEKQTDPLSLPAFGENGVNVVIEIPAGTSRKNEFNKITGEFEPAEKIEPLIDFLPLPGNYGFIPSTELKTESGDGGKTLSALVISENLPAGTVLEMIPIAALVLEESGYMETKIIGVPADPAKRIIQATNFEHLLINYNMAQNIIQNWFLNYKGLGKISLIRWQDEKYAMETIRQNLLKVE